MLVLVAVDCFFLALEEDGDEVNWFIIVWTRSTSDKTSEKTGMLVEFWCVNEGGEFR